MSDAVRTLLQPLDSIRYKGRSNFDQEIDRAHARCELLIAILFGFDIVVSANDLADSQGFMVIFREYLEGGQDQIGEYRRKTFQSYRPFKAGLKEIFRKDSAGNNAYDAYVADVAKKMGVRRDDSYVNFGDGTEVLKECIRLFQAGFEGESRLKTEPALAPLLAHIRRIYEYFSPRYQRIDDAVYTGINIAQDDAHLFTRSIRDSCKRVVERGSKATKAAEATETSLNEVLDLGVRLRNRDDWRAVSTDLANWEVVRSWIDIALHRRLCLGYEVMMPSYFTQDLSTAGDDPELFYGILDNASYALAHTHTPDTNGLLLPGVNFVDWDTILRLVLSGEFQARLRDLHAEMHRVQAEAKAERGRVIRSNATALRDELQGLDIKRRNNLAELLAGHAAYLTGQSAGVALVTKGTKIIREDDGSYTNMPVVRAQLVQRWDEIVTERWDWVRQMGVQISALAAAYPIPAGHPAALVAVGAVGVLGSTAPRSSINGVVNWLRRADLDALAKGDQLLARQLSRANFSIG